MGIVTMGRRRAGAHAAPRHRAPRTPRTGRVRAVAALAAVTAVAMVATAGYTVRPGDTLSAIAARYGTSVAALAKANGLTDPDVLFAGSTLTIPGSSGGSGGASTTSGATGGAATHRVAVGEHLTGIARRHGVTVRALMDANGLSDPDRIFAGSTLTIPGGSASEGGSAVTASTRSTSGSGAPTGARSRTEVGALIERTAAAHGWNPAFVKALAWQESGWRNDVVSHAGAVGIMQVMPGTGDFISRNLAGRTLDLHDPEENVLAGVLFLDYLYRLTGRDAERTLAGYYQGLASVNRNGLYDDTRRYIANVLTLRERFR